MPRDKVIVKNPTLESELARTENSQINNNLENEEILEDFDSILDLIGSKGKYQKFFLYGILSPLIVYLAFLSSSTIFLFSTPNHWCKVDGQNSSELWKNQSFPIPNMTLTKDDKCKIYSIKNQSRVEESCTSWEFDQTDFEETISSKLNWVCDKSHFPTSIYTAAEFGAIFGGILHGILTDKLGRKPLFMISLLIGFILRIIILLAPQYMSFNLYLFLHFLNSLLPTNMFGCLTLILVEISHKDYRSWIISYTWVLWVMGSASLPIVAWLTRHWLTLGLIANLPKILFIFAYFFILESPRWLLSIGKINQARDILLKIALKNGNSHKVNPDLIEKSLKRIVKIENDRKTQENKFSSKVCVWTLFSKKTLAKNTVLMCICISINSVIYLGLTLNSTQMSGNQFLNFFLLSIIEIPSGILGGYISKNYGRRWPQSISFCFSFIAFLIAVLSTTHPSLFYLDIISLVIAKFTINFSFLIAAIQINEIFPTILRSTGSGLADTVSSTLATIGPYIIYTGLFNKSLPYWILSGFCIAGAISSAFLPETMDISLPENVEEANQLEIGQKFWSWPRKRKNDSFKDSTIKSDVL